MVVQTRSLPGSPESPAIHLPAPVSTAGRWRMVGQFSTAEAAQKVMHDLQAKGIESSLSLLGGLSVIARN